MRIILTGGSGYIGTELKEYYLSLGFEVVNIGRKHFRRNIHDFKELFREADVIIHLSGASIFARWTSRYKKELFRSRIETLEKIHAALKLIKERPTLLISASAVGLYAFDDEVHTEENFRKGQHFMGDLVSDWEAAANRFRDLEGMRVVIMRLGVILGKNAPSYQKMESQFKWFVGGRFGKGTQPFSYLHIDDLKALSVFFMQRKDVQGAFNMVTPELVTNREFGKLMGRVLHRPSFFIVPSFILWLMKGKASVLLTKGSKVAPERLLKMGYRFKYPDAVSVLQALNSDD
jgi:uncharacterized protein